MTQEQFDQLNNKFNSIISHSDLESTKVLIDGESILSRVSKKINNVIPSRQVALLMLFNIHIYNEQYESAQSIKDMIMTDVSKENN